MTKDPDLSAAYALTGPEDAKALYRSWAATYDADFGDAQGYRLPMEVARAYVAAGGVGPVLDVGAGTGVVAKGLSSAGIEPIDAVDLSEEMLKIAGKKSLYRALIPADVTQPVDLPGTPYAGVVSAGTFTLGHLGPGALLPIFDLAASGALFVISVNAAHFTSAGFEGFLSDHADRIATLRTEDVRIYTDKADADHRDSIARLLIFRLI